MCSFGGMPPKEHMLKGMTQFNLHSLSYQYILHRVFTKLTPEYKLMLY